jgi:transposase-like protein
MSRVSSARERWQRIVQRQRSSGLSVAAFCGRHGVAASSLFAWKRRLAREAEAAVAREPAFVAVQAVPGAATADSDLDRTRAIELHWGGSRWLVLRRGFDAQALREVLAVLEGRP